MKRLLALAAALALAGAFASLDPAAEAVPLPHLSGGIFDDLELTCYSPTPAAAHVPVVDDDGTIDIDLAVVADREVSEARALQIVERAKASYAAQNINLDVHSVQHVDFSATDALDYLDELRAHFGGTRPFGADVVAAITSADLTIDAGGEPNSAVGGIARCIGGVRSAQDAFFVGEDTAFTYRLEDGRVFGGDDGFNAGPLKFYNNLPAKVFAHELGHIMGAHHHYANCAEGNVVDGEAVTDVSPCTLMTNFGDFISSRFGSAEAAIVRGYAEEYARP